MNTVPAFLRMPPRRVAPVRTRGQLGAVDTFTVDPNNPVIEVSAMYGDSLVFNLPVGNSGAIESNWANPSVNPTTEPIGTYSGAQPGSANPFVILNANRSGSVSLNWVDTYGNNHTTFINIYVSAIPVTQKGGPVPIIRNPGPAPVQLPLSPIHPPLPRFQGPLGAVGGWVPIDSIQVPAAIQTSIRPWSSSELPPPPTSPGQNAFGPISVPAGANAFVLGTFAAVATSHGSASTGYTSSFQWYRWSTQPAPPPVPFPRPVFPRFRGPLGDLDDGMKGADGGCSAEPVLDPRIYWAVQRQLQQFPNCPRCGPGSYCSCGAGYGYGSLGAPMQANHVPDFMRLPSQRGRVGCAPCARALGRVGAPSGDVYASLSATQQAWVLGALAAWYNAAATQAWYNVNSSSCPGVSVGMDLTNATNRAALVACFQVFTNAQMSQGGAITTGGTLDAMTLAALQANYVAAGGAACPNGCGITPSGTSTTTSYTGWIVGGLAAAAVAGGIWYAATHRNRSRAESRR